MAISSPMPLYHDPMPNRSRRASSTRSFAPAMSRSASSFDAPRTACPKDGDAFSYDPAHLNAWQVPQNLWDILPADLKASIAAMQHAGAAVLTGLERLEKHTADNGDKRPRADSKAPLNDLLGHLEDLPSPKFRSFSNASSVLHSDFSSPLTGGSPASQSGCTSPVMSTFSLSQSNAPASPMSLGPPDVTDKRARSRDRSFSTPLEPHDAYYATELSHLRTESLVRLRHMCHKVDPEWYEAKRTGQIEGEDANAFENWWAEKKCAILRLDDEVKRLAATHGVAPTGMGWTAP